MRPVPWRAGMLAIFGMVLWGVGASGFLIWQTRITQSDTTPQPLANFWDLAQQVSGVSTWLWLVLLACALMAFAALWLALSRWLDPQGNARAALVWPWRAWPFWTAALLLLALAGVLHEQAVVEMTVTVVGLLALLFLPWLAWTPAALEGEAPRWARPRWPGVLPFLVWLGGGLFLAMASAVLDTAGPPVRWMQPLVFPLLNVLNVLWALLTAALWLRGTWPVRVPASAFLRGSAAGEYLWFVLAFAGLALLAMAPILTVMIQAMFVLPQFDEAARVAGVPEAWPVLWQMKLARAVGAMLDFGFSVLGMLYFGLSLGRWLWLRRMAADEQEGLA